MEGILLIIAIIAYNVFIKRKKKQTPEEKGQPMTWEEMEREFGISIERKETEGTTVEESKIPIETQPSEPIVVKIEETKPVEEKWEMAETSAPKASFSVSRRKAREGIIWAEIMMPPKCKRKVK